MDKHITAPFDKKQVEDLHAGDYVYTRHPIFKPTKARKMPCVITPSNFVKPLYPTVL